LKIFSDVILALVSKCKEYLSIADIYQLVNHIVLIHSVFDQDCTGNCEHLDINYYYGRIDCPTAPNHTGVDDTGTPHGDFTEIERILSEFNLTKKEMVALMGAHALGGAHKVVTGWNFNWQKNSSTFSHQYYKNMVGLDFRHEDVAKIGDPPAAGRRLEFVHRDPKEEALNIQPTMMFNIDVSSFRHLKSSKNANGAFNGDLTCLAADGDEIEIEDNIDGVLNSCQYAPTAAYVLEFAQNQKHFFKTYSKAHFKMVTHGYKELYVPEGDYDCGSCIPEAAFCKPGFLNSGQCCSGYKCIGNKCTKK